MVCLVGAIETSLTVREKSEGISSAWYGTKEGDADAEGGWGVDDGFSTSTDYKQIINISIKNTTT